MSNSYDRIISFIKELFQTKDYIPLHAPTFEGNERKYILETIDSTYVSSVGKYVDRFEDIVKEYTGAKFAIATVNGTSALHMSLILAGVKKGDMVITQALSFIATCNAISYLNAEPVFVDVDRETMGLSPRSLLNFLELNTVQKNGNCFYKKTNQRISACVPMHTFGHPVRIKEIKEICEKFNLVLVEDAAESMGSFTDGIHTGNFGKLGVFSFNGNKTVTCGGGGIIITNDESLGKLGKHLTTQAKLPHKWEFVHDFIGYNYRLPNLNAALAYAQMEQIEKFVENKRKLAQSYSDFFQDSEFIFFEEQKNVRSNYWLNSLIAKNLNHRNEALTKLNDSMIMARPSWELMHKLKMFNMCIRGPLDNSEWLSDRLLNIPSSYRSFA